MFLKICSSSHCNTTLHSPSGDVTCIPVEMDSILADCFFPKHSTPVAAVQPDNLPPLPTQDLAPVSSVELAHTLSLLRAKPAPPYLKRELDVKLPSPPSPPLKPSYSQIVKTKIPPCDPTKWACDPGKVTCDSSCDPLPALVSCDSSCDPLPALVSRDQSQDQIQLHDPTCFGHATYLLIGTWKTVGTYQ